MKTTCPHCQTAFRVNEEQLDQHGGDVRCGRCGEVFSGYDFLDGQEEHHPAPRSEPPPPVMAVPPTADAGGPGRVAEDVAAGGPEPADGAPEEEMPAVIEMSIPAAEPDVLPQEDDAQPVAGPEPAVDEAAADVEKAATPASSRRWLWVSGCLLALAGLAGQAAVAHRTELSLSQPELRPVLEQLCVLAGCRIELPRQSELLSIESSELQADPAAAETVILIASLRNRGRHAQAYPQLELTLTDSQDKMVARRTFLPREYYPQADTKSGFAPGGDILVKLPLQLKGLNAVGYRLYLYYPQ